MLIGEAFYRGQLIVCNGESQSGWYDDLDWIFRHKDQVCHASKKQTPHDPNAPYDGYDESDDTEQNAKAVRLEKVKPVINKRNID